MQVKAYRAGGEKSAGAVRRDSAAPIRPPVGYAIAVPSGPGANMECEISPAPSGRHVRIKVLVPMTSATGSRCGNEAVRLGLAMKIDRYLFDLRDSQNVQSVVENYEFVHKEFMEFDFPKRSRSAFLVGADDKSHDFINTAFSNAGYITRLFTDEAAAIAWLEEEPPPEKARDWRDHFL
jgi:hypothetical protein